MKHHCNVLYDTQNPQTCDNRDTPLWWRNSKQLGSHVFHMLALKICNKDFFFIHAQRRCVFCQHTKTKELILRKFPPGLCPPFVVQGQILALIHSNWPLTVKEAKALKRQFSAKNKGVHHVPCLLGRSQDDFVERFGLSSWTPHGSF